MAALVTGDSFELNRLPQYLENNLPFFARPVFLRFRQEIETTTTFKQRKIQLQKEGFDPAAISDQLWVRVWPPLALASCRTSAGTDAGNCQSRLRKASFAIPEWCPPWDHTIGPIRTKGRGPLVGKAAHCSSAHGAHLRSSL
jgi:hypothetical protein